MTPPSPPFAEALQTLAADLRGTGGSHVELWRAAARIDHLGRQLHGLGLERHAEIAASFTAAVEELAAAHEDPEAERPARVGRAADALEAAVGHLAG